MSESEHKVYDDRDMRLTIAYLAMGVSDTVGQALLTGAVDVARERDVNLLCFVGGRLRDPTGSSSPANVIYDLVDAGVVDGLVSWASAVSGFLEHDEAVSFHRRYHPLPVVSIALPMEGVPTLLIENYAGMRDAILHLIEVHECRRLAFIRGPEGHYYSQERYRAYTDTLEAYDISFDPNLVIPPGDFVPTTGTDAVRLLLDERKLRPGVDFDALVGVSDLFALSALRELQRRGIRVPDDVTVVGFNDAVEGRFVRPALTSVRPPFYETGRQALEMLLALMEGERVPDRVVLPSELIVRRSCGCKSSAVASAGLPPPIIPVGEGAGKPEALLTTRREDILAEVMQAVEELGGELDPGWAGQLLDSLIAELEGGQAGGFVAVLDEGLGQAAVAAGDAVGGSIAAVQNAVSTLRGILLPYLDGEPLSRAESLWQQARVVIGEAAEQAQAYQALQTEQQAAALREVSQALLTTFDLEGLTDALVEGLPQLNTPSLFLSMYRDLERPTETSQLVLAYSESCRVGLGTDRMVFPSSQLMPDGMWPDRQYIYVVQPLYFQNSQLGFVLCEVGPREGLVYEILGVQISSALQGALLVQRVQERSADLARQQYILDTFMENIPDRVYFKDLESHITRANKAHAARLGLSDPAEEIGKSDFDFFPEEQARVKYEQEQEIIRTGQSLLGIEEVDDAGHWSLTAKMPLRDENGEITGTFGISRDITKLKEAQTTLEQAYAEVEQQVAERTAELKREQEESARLQQEVIEAQQRAIRELSTPIIPVLEGVIVMPLIGSIDTMRARDVTRNLLAGIREHHAKVVILDITGVPIVDSRVAAYLNKTVQAARLKGARTIVTGISDAVAETIVDLEIDWSGIETLGDLQTGLWAVMRRRNGK